MAKQAEDAAKIAEMQRQALAEQQRIALEQHQAAEQHRLVQEAEKKRQAESQFEEEAKLKAAELDKQRGFHSFVATKGETEERAGKLANEEALDLEERDDYEKPPTVEKKKSSKQPK
jgi:hypothetical protein